VLKSFLLRLRYEETQAKLSWANLGTSDHSVEGSLRWTPFFSLKFAITYTKSWPRINFVVLMEDCSSFSKHLESQVSDFRLTSSAQNQGAAMSRSEPSP